MKRLKLIHSYECENLFLSVSELLLYINGNTIGEAVYWLLTLMTVPDGGIQFVLRGTDMTAISSVSSHHHLQSPRAMLQDELLSEISSGSINGSDQKALSSALDNIDSAIKSDTSSRSGPPSAAEVQSKIDDLINSQVKNGKLTTDQAKELKNVFAKAMPQGAPGNPPGPEGSVALDSSNGTDQGDSSADTVLKGFLKMIQDAHNTTGYGASGIAQKSLEALLVSFQT